MKLALSTSIIYLASSAFAGGIKEHSQSAAAKSTEIVAGIPYNDETDIAIVYAELIQSEYEGMC